MVEPFIKGPIPLRWLARASAAGGSALEVGLEIWFWAGLKRSNRIAISLSRLRVSPTLSRSAASRGLQKLESAGLVRAQRLPGRKPIVELLKIREG
jgi:hypothetical protein